MAGSDLKFTLEWNATLSSDYPGRNLFEKVALGYENQTRTSFDKETVEAFINGDIDFDNWKHSDYFFEGLIYEKLIRALLEGEL